LFSLEPCILFTGRAEDWIAPLVVDAAYFYSRVFISQYFFDFILPLKPSRSRLHPRTVPHYLKTLELLRERFADDSNQERLSNTTVAVVMSLAGHAYMTGDLRSARHHMGGLYRIINLRGGVTEFRENPKLLLEIFRYNSPPLMVLQIRQGLTVTGAI
jgi:hypothetical protein